MSCEVGGGTAGLAGSDLSDGFGSSGLVLSGLVSAFTFGAILVGACAVGVGSARGSAGWAASSMRFCFRDEAGAGGADSGAHGRGGVLRFVSCSGGGDSVDAVGFAVGSAGAAGAGGVLDMPPLRDDDVAISARMLVHRSRPSAEEFLRGSLAGQGERVTTSTDRDRETVRWEGC
jgi:hypothetical protein